MIRTAQQLFYQQLDLLKFIVAKGLPRAIKAIAYSGKMEEHSEAPTLTEVETEELRLILSRVKAPAITAEKAL
jgi:4-hydroxy-tetrahydrodipicolinate synthase